MQDLLKKIEKARALEGNEQPEAALAEYERVLADVREAESAGIWRRIAELQFRLAREDDALASYTRAIDLYDAAGLDNNALALCHAALRRAPDHPALLRRLAALAVEQGYRSDARTGALGLVESAGNGDESAAEQTLRAYLRRFPDDREAAAILAERFGGAPAEAAPAPAQEGTLPTFAPAVEEVAEELELLGTIPEVEQRAEEDEAGGEIAPLLGLEPTLLGGEWDEPPGAAEAAPAPSREPRDEPAGDVEEDAAEGGLAGDLPMLPGLETAEVPVDAPALDGLEAADETDFLEPLPVLEAPEPLPTLEEPEPLPLLGVDDEIGVGLAAPAPAGEEGDESEPGDELDRLRSLVATQPHDLDARVRFADHLERRGLPDELERVLAAAHRDFAAAERYAEAADLAGRLAALRPGDLALRQSRVEYAHRAGDDARLVAAFLDFAGVLDPSRARVLYQRVLDLDPGNEVARRALADSAPRTDFVDLGALVLEDEPEETARFRVATMEPTGDEDRDFAEVLERFREQIAEGLDPRDAESHYDLGLAFKEMGLLDDAVAQLQKALLAGANPLPTLEMLGESYHQKGEHEMAVRVLERATRMEAATDEALVGVLYWLARSEEALGHPDRAASAYRRVVAAAPDFRDAARRLEALPAF